VASLELYAVGATPPEQVWALVGDLRRLSEWTDADSAEVSGPVAVGTVVTTRDGERVLEWRITTAEQRLVEAVTTLPRGELGIGVRVARDPYGSRLIMAAGFTPADRVAALGWLLLGGPAMRRRFDRWTRTALRPHA